MENNINNENISRLNAGSIESIEIWRTHENLAEVRGWNAIGVAMERFVTNMATVDAIIEAYGDRIPVEYHDVYLPGIKRRKTS